jgi:DNA helicase-2/ATP-dependent DNA helicase PcrA
MPTPTVASAAVDALLDALTDAQRRAVTHPGGPLWVSAVPGSGKTRVLVARAAWLIAQGVAPQHLLAVTFSRRAAREIVDRLAAALGPQARRLWAGTLHAFATWVLRAHARLAGRTPAFAIWDAADQRRALRLIARDLGLDTDPGRLVEAIDAAKRGAPRALGALGPAERHDLARALPAYTEALRAHDAFDFNDLIIHAAALLAGSPALRAALRRRFTHLLVDEAQDLSPYDHALIELLAGGQSPTLPPLPRLAASPEGDALLAAWAPDAEEAAAPPATLTVAADEDQSVYGWRGGDPGRLLAFERIYPGAAVVDLGDNHRSTPQILAVAERLIAHNRLRRAKPLRAVNPDGPAPELWRFAAGDEEATAVAARLEGWLAEGLRPIGILARLNVLLGPVARACQRRGLRARVLHEVPLAERKEIRDLLAYLRAAVRPDDWPAHERALTVPPRGVGQVRLARLRQEALARGADRALAEAAERLRPVADYRALLDTLRGLSPSPSAMLARLVERIGYRHWLATTDPEGSDRRWTHVEALLDLAQAWESQGGLGTQAFLDELLLDETAGQQAGEADVECMTIHASKGAEFPAVVVLGLEEGLLPSAHNLEADALEEERRLCYVAFTRARLRLAATTCGERLLWGRPRPLLPSRFLSECGLAP